VFGVIVEVEVEGKEEEEVRVDEANDAAFTI